MLNPIPRSSIYFPEKYKELSDKKEAENPSLVTLLSVGGANADNEKFTFVISSEENRVQFAANSLAYLRQHKFDGGTAPLTLEIWHKTIENT